MQAKIRVFSTTGDMVSCPIAFEGDYQFTINQVKQARAPVEKARTSVTLFCEVLKVKDIMISSDIGRLAVEASIKYGKAVGHKADLNFGGCLSYTAARYYRAPLLFKGDDFSQTDINIKVKKA